MTTSVRMDEDWSHMTETIFNLTLEIICLLTGEGFSPVESGDQVTITVPPHHFLAPEKKKILQVINKITELLMGEVPIGCQDVPPFSSNEKWLNVGGHKDLSKYIMMETQPPLTSPDGSSDRNPPERSTGPLYSWDCPQEDHTIPHHYQGVELTDLKNNTEETQLKIQQRSAVESGLVKSIKKEQETFVRGDQKTMEEGDMMRTFKMEEEEIYMRSDKQSIEQGNMMTIKEEEETYVRSDQQSMEDGDMIRTIKEEEETCVRSDQQCIEKSNVMRINKVLYKDGHDVGNSSEGHLHSRNTAAMPHQAHHTGAHPFSCSDCGKCFKNNRNLQRHQRSHTGNHPLSCSECGKGFYDKTNLLRHQLSHTGKRPFSCLECGKCFSRKSNLVNHQRFHTGEHPFSCSECGKGFGKKRSLLVHQRSHTGERSCSECGKGFVR